MIEFRNIKKYYGELKALDDVSLVIPNGEIYGLVGKSGAGKSTLLRTINKLEDVDSGEIIVNGVTINDLKGKELREYRKGVGMVFQQFSLLETENIYNNIALPLRCNGYSKDAIQTKVLELAEVVGLTEKLKVYPRQLSGGQKQRVAIARALALEPKLLLCDEATSALDPITTMSILELLKKINRETGITIVIVTHQMEVIKTACDEIAIIEHGKIIEKGATDELFLSPNSFMKTLVNEQEILPDTGVNIRLYFPKKCSSDTFITTMVKETNVNFSICWGKLERFKEDVLGSLIINLNKEDEATIVNYIKKQNDVLFEVLGGKR